MRHTLSATLVATLLSAVLALLAACAPPIQAEQAKKFVERYYDHLQNKRFEQAIEMYDERRLAQKSAPTWINELVKRHEQLGDLKQYSLTRFEVNTQYRGRLYIFEYTTTYAAQTAAETVTLFEDHDGMTMKIVAHDVSL